MYEVGDLHPSRNKEYLAPAARSGRYNMPPLQQNRFSSSGRAVNGLRHPRPPHILPILI